jgi:hypothetical protein
MAYAIAQVPQGKLVDTNRKVNGAIVAQLAADGYAGMARYVPLPSNPAQGDIDAAELGVILGGGLGLLLIQHVRFEGWDPAQCSGSADAARAIQSAQAAGYLPGAHIFVDLEGPAAQATAGSMIAFANDWADAIVAAGYLAGCYVGFGLPLSPDQLYSELYQINSYWSDAGPRKVAVRGFAIKQGQGFKIEGVPFDHDVVTPDQKGQTPLWTVNAAAIA